MEKLAAEIRLEYLKGIDLDPEERSKLISNKILDIFDAEYHNILISGKTSYADNQELAQFIEFFLTPEFDKQIHVNIWISMCFVHQSELTKVFIKKIKDQNLDL
jgi:ABC-type thiamine transport system substrate-binding protein